MGTLWVSEAQDLKDKLLDAINNRDQDALCNWADNHGLDALDTALEYSDLYEKLAVKFQEEAVLAEIAKDMIAALPQIGGALTILDTGASLNSRQSPRFVLSWRDARGKYHEVLANDLSQAFRWIKESSGDKQ